MASYLDLGLMHGIFMLRFSPKMVEISPSEIRSTSSKIGRDAAVLL